MDSQSESTRSSATLQLETHTTVELAIYTMAEAFGAAGACPVKTIKNKRLLTAQTYRLRQLMMIKEAIQSKMLYFVSGLGNTRRWTNFYSV